MSRTAVVVTHGGRPEALVALREASHALTEAGFKVILRGQEPTPIVTDSESDEASAKPDPDVTGAEIVIVLGGDGTILRAAELTRGTRVPLVGINLGHVGFLAESEREGLHSVVRRIAAGDYDVEERAVVDVRVDIPGQAEPFLGWALNEATVEKADRARMLEVGINVDGRALSSFGCDGVVLSTATGSTAHAFSAGGPVVWPDVDAMLLVPLSAHALFARPLVVGPRSTLAVEILPRSRERGVLIMDGRRRLDLPQGSRITVSRSAEPVRLARMSHAPFTDRLVRKFALPVIGWRGDETQTKEG